MGNPAAFMIASRQDGLSSEDFGLGEEYCKVEALSANLEGYQKLSSASFRGSPSNC